jgi:serine/threonine-protein kinase
MTLSAGTQLGPYRIEALLGVGGMGEVYRATDTALGRQVAIKVLPESVATDPDRLARFEREAKTLAALNHPNIAQIYGLERSGGTQAIVMELVEGETLADRIARGPIPIDEALPIAKQIAEAFESAHEQGIIHRDLKPANIKITSAGRVKVLDFGLAKLHEPSAPNASTVPRALSMSPTITSPALMTGMGTLLGTAAYMSPEQAKGKPADKRSDVWAFGCVLYEMLTGKRAFDGEDMVDVLGAVARLDPNWAAIPVDVPAVVRTLIQSCLVKDRRKRAADISVALFVLEQGTNLAASSDVGISQARADAAIAEVRRELARSSLRRVAIVSTLALTAGVAVATITTWFVMRPTPPRVTRTAIAFSPPAVLTVHPADRDLAITPDGSAVIYVGNAGTQIFVRRLGSLEPVALFTGTPRGPFVSPDGQWVGFVDADRVLKKVAVTGGPAITLATFDTTNVGAPRGATWGTDGVITFATADLTTGLLRIPAAGGAVTVLTRPDRGRSEGDHAWPEVLPGGRALLFTITAAAGGLDADELAVLDLQTGKHNVLLRGGNHAHYVPSGYLVYSAAGALRAIRFDLATLETRGTPVPVAQVVTKNTGAVDAAFADDGTLAYVSGDISAAAVQQTLAWVDRQGRETPIMAPARAYSFPRVSPDGSRVAVFSAYGGSDIWIADLSRNTLTRATFDKGFDLFPLWTPDGRRLIFSSDGSGALNVYWELADGTGTVERLTNSPNPQVPTAVSPDGRQLIFYEHMSKTGDDVMQMTLDGTRRSIPLVQSPFDERNGIVSPDGRWLAYEANESGRFEVYVRPYPDVSKGRWQISVDGGTQPVWSRTGDELIYVSSTGALVGVRVRPGAAWVSTTATQLVNPGYFTGAGPGSVRRYDVSSDGQRFLVVKDAETDQDGVPPQLIVVQHFDEELKRLVPTK